MLLRPKETYIEPDYGEAKDIYFMAYNSFYHDRKALFHVMQLQEKYICRPAFEKRRVCVLFFYTDITNEVIQRFLDQLEQCNEHIEKAAIVGVPVNARAYFVVRTKRNNSKIAPYQFFSDAKSAVDWLNT